MKDIKTPFIIHYQPIIHRMAYTSVDYKIWFAKMDEQETLRLGIPLQHLDALSHLRNRYCYRPLP